MDVNGFFFKMVLCNITFGPLENRKSMEERRVTECVGERNRTQYQITHLSRGIPRRWVSRHVEVIVAEKEQQNDNKYVCVCVNKRCEERGVGVFTCLCLGPPGASHPGSGLKKNSLYWALPTCGERTESIERRDRGGMIGGAGRGWKRRL